MKRAEERRSLRWALRPPEGVDPSAGRAAGRPRVQEVFVRATDFSDALNPAVRSSIPSLILVLAAIVISIGAGPYWSYLGVVACYTTLFVLSSGLVFGQAGMLSLCPLAFGLVGAWIAGWCAIHEKGLTLPIVMVLAMVVAVPIGGLIGMLAIRLRGMNLAIATVAVGQVAYVLLGPFPVPGYVANIAVPRPAFAQSQQGYFLFAVAVIVIILTVISVIIRGPLGATWAMLREERGSAAVGKNVTFGKLTVFCISAAVASAGGVLLIGQNGSADPTSFSLGSSLLIVVLAIFLGGGTPEGAVTGGILGGLSPWLFDELKIADDLPNLFFAYGAVDVLSLFPAGISVHHQQRRRAARAARAARRAGDAVQVSSEFVTGAATAESMVVGPVQTSPPSISPSPGEPALSVKELSVRYGGFSALSSVSFDVPAGIVMGLIGPNGAGKTTFLDAVSGFAAYTGAVEVGGESFDGMAPHRRVRAGLRRTFQQTRASADLTIERYIQFVSGSSFTTENMRLVLDLFELRWTRRYIGEMDVPTRRLVEVTAVVVAAPEVLLLDEPAAGLGELESRALGQRFAAIPSLFGSTVVLIEHDMEVVRSACSSLVVLDYGQVIATGPTDEVLDSRIVRTAYLGIEEGESSDAVPS